MRPCYVWIKTGVVCLQRLQRSGYVFGQSDWCYPTEDMPVCAFSWWRFSASFRFQAIDPNSWSKLLKSSPKNCFGESDRNNKVNKVLSPLSISPSLWTDSWSPKFTCSCQDSWNQYSRTEQTGAFFPTKIIVFYPFSLEATSLKVFYDHSFQPLPSVKFRPYRSSFRGNIRENIFQTNYNIGMKPVSLSPTKKNYSAVRTTSVVRRRWKDSYDSLQSSLAVDHINRHCGIVANQLTNQSVKTHLHVEPRVAVASEL